MNHLKISFKYIDYAHGPSAESDNKAAQRLFELPVKCGYIYVDLNDCELRNELNKWQNCMKSRKVYGVCQVDIQELQKKY